MAESNNTIGEEDLPMEKPSNLAVTFSRRRTGLFKKASELCVLCGAEVGLVVFSPSQKVYSFGHPSANTVIDRFLAENPTSVDSDSIRFIDFQMEAKLKELNAELHSVLCELESEKKRGEELDQAMKATQMWNWWEAPIEQLNEEQLKVLKTALDGLKKAVRKENEVRVRASNPLRPHATNLGDPGGIHAFSAVDCAFIVPRCA
ncbi:Transcription factor, MADS-box [Dillenia turbinata]|uniref:Transcription factor, MADS-box n=1 Tax=Dillenia turbinata TaxID=194707 RepID=A0AAN8ZQ30_9MAGN